MLRGVKSGNARGSDGFTAGDLRSMHGTILQWLFPARLLIIASQGHASGKE